MWGFFLQILTIGGILTELTAGVLDNAAVLQVFDYCWTEVFFFLSFGRSVLLCSSPHSSAASDVPLSVCTASSSLPPRSRVKPIFEKTTDRNSCQFAFSVAKQSNVRKAPPPHPTARIQGSDVLDADLQEHLTD